MDSDRQPSSPSGPRWVRTRFLRDLTTAAETLGKLQGPEGFLLERSTCPKCGGKIVETERAIGGGHGEAPSEVNLRTGCKDCEFELYSETVTV